MAVRFRAKEQTYLDKEAKKTFKAWHPQIKVEGKWCFLSDENSRTKLLEADDEIAALEMAIKAYREIEGKMNAG